MKKAIDLLILAIIIVVCALGILYKESETKIRKLEFQIDSTRIANERRFVCDIY